MIILITKNIVKKFWQKLESIKFRTFISKQLKAESQLSVSLVLGVEKIGNFPSTFVEIHVNWVVLGRERNAQTFTEDLYCQQVFNSHHCMAFFDTLTLVHTDENQQFRF